MKNQTTHTSEPSSKTSLLKVALRWITFMIGISFKRMKAPLVNNKLHPNHNNQQGNNPQNEVELSSTKYIYIYIIIKNVDELK